MAVPSPRPLVSVIVPAWNYGRYLGATLASVQAQTFREWELIVVDDGSTDDTRAVTEAQADPRIIYHFQENAGLSAARNTGLRLARGEYVAFLDADDLWKPEFLATVLLHFEKAGPSYGLIASETERIGPDGETLPQPRHQKRFRVEEELTARRLCLRNRPFPSAVVARREVYAAAGEFEITLRSSEDRDMWIRAAEKFRFRMLAEPLTLIRRHPSNMSKNAPRMKANTRETLRRAWRRGAVSRLDFPFWARAWAVFYFQIAWTHFDAGYRAAAFRYLACSWLLWPVFAAPERFCEPSLFRLRALSHFLIRTLRAGRRGEPAPAPRVAAIATH